MGCHKKVPLKEGQLVSLEQVSHERKEEMIL
jgi:hypothetical protein